MRNIVAFQDLGESSSVSTAVNVFVGPSAYPDNGNNGFDPTAIGNVSSQLTDAIRDISTLQTGILVPNVTEGFGYGKLENLSLIHI